MTPPSTSTMLLCDQELPMLVRATLGEDSREASSRVSKTPVFPSLIATPLRWLTTNDFQLSQENRSNITPASFKNPTLKDLPSNAVDSIEHHLNNPIALINSQTQTPKAEFG